MPASGRKHSISPFCQHTTQVPFIVNSSGCHMHPKSLTAAVFCCQQSPISFKQRHLCWCSVWACAASYPHTPTCYCRCPISRGQSFTYRIKVSRDPLDRLNQLRGWNMITIPPPIGLLEYAAWSSRQLVHICGRLFTTCICLIHPCCPPNTPPLHLYPITHAHSLLGPPTHSPFSLSPGPSTPLPTLISGG